VFRGRQSPELQYVGPIKHLIATVATLSIIRNIVSIRRIVREDEGKEEGKGKSSAFGERSIKLSPADNLIGGRKIA